MFYLRLAPGIYDQQPELAKEGSSGTDDDFAPKSHFRSCNEKVAAPVHNGAAEMKIVTENEAFERGPNDSTVL